MIDDCSFTRHGTSALGPPARDLDVRVQEGHIRGPVQLRPAGCGAGPLGGRLAEEVGEVPLGPAPRLGARPVVPAVLSSAEAPWRRGGDRLLRVDRELALAGRPEVPRQALARTERKPGLHALLALVPVLGGVGAPCVDCRGALLDPPHVAEDLRGHLLLLAPAGVHPGPCLEEVLPPAVNALGPRVSPFQVRVRGQEFPRDGLVVAAGVHELHRLCAVAELNEFPCAAVQRAPARAPCRRLIPYDDPVARICCCLHIGWPWKDNLPHLTRSLKSTVHLIQHCILP
mmetsp:Transcript_36853/g.102266  ORF Transcript_36853/g.102266 Transcript_36853/m.102266 type:complete len:286 (+) Transcript_36853:535-1392(+)